MDVGMSAKATVTVPGERDRVPLWERRKSRRSFIGKASSRLTSLPQGENPGAGQAGGLIRACNAAWCRNRVARLALDTTQGRRRASCCNGVGEQRISPQRP